jgi:hypothetical protein
MKKTPTKVKQELSTVWKDFYHGPGRAAIAELMVWCNVYSSIETNDPIELAKAEGERAVALRIAQLIGLRPEHFPTQSWDDADTLDRMLNIRQ